MSIELTDNYDDYDKDKLKILHGMLEYINSKVKEDGICRFYDSKLNVVAKGSTQDKAYERFQKYIKENPDKTVGKEIGDYKYYVRMTFNKAPNDNVLFEDGAIRLYTRIFIVYINKRNRVSFEMPMVLKDVKDKYKGIIMINAIYKPSQINKFKNSHLKKIANSLFIHEIKGNNGLVPIEKLSWFK